MTYTSGGMQVPVGVSVTTSPAKHWPIADRAHAVIHTTGDLDEILTPMGRKTTTRAIPSPASDSYGRHMPQRQELPTRFDHAPTGSGALLLVALVVFSIGLSLAMRAWIL